MKKKTVRLFIALGLTIFINILFSKNTNAALNISTSKTEVLAGESFSVTVSVDSSEAGAINLSATNASLSTSYVDLMSTNSVTVTCTAGSSGTINISASGKVANYNTETENSQSASKTISIKAASNNQINNSSSNSESIPSASNSNSSSSNNSSSNLTAISIDGKQYANGENVPAVENDKDTVKISAVGTSRYSLKVNGNSVSGTTARLEEGTNEILVTNLDDGKSIKVYIIRKAKENPIPNVIDETQEEEQNKEASNEEDVAMQEVEEANEIVTAEAKNVKSQGDDKVNFAERLVFCVVLVVTILIGAIIITIVLIIRNNKIEKMQNEKAVEQKETEISEESHNEPKNFEENKQKEIKTETKKVKGGKHRAKRFK